jgi:hypothetical protein
MVCAMTIHQPPPIFIPAFLVVIAVVLPYFISKLSGWDLLATRFRATQTFTGSRWGWQSARVRHGLGYNNCLTIGADHTGIYVSMVFFFRLQHPPLLVPWNEVYFQREFKLLFVRFVEFRLGSTEQVPFAIRESLAKQLQSAAGLNWPSQPSPQGFPGQPAP